MHDRDAARLNRDHGFHEHACFLAQQSAEKALKAFLYARGEGPVLGHSTFSLAVECAEHESTFETLRDACRRLDQLYIQRAIPTAYPTTSRTTSTIGISPTRHWRICRPSSTKCSASSRPELAHTEINEKLAAAILIRAGKKG